MIGIVEKEGRGRLNGSRLVGILKIDGEVESFTQEHNACGVAVDTVDTDGTITGGVTKECYILVGVCQQTAGHGGFCCCHHQCEAAHT